MSPAHPSPAAQLPGPPARPSLEDILRPEDYQHRLRIARGDPAPFFQPWDPTGAILAERRHWLDTHPERHAPYLPEADPLVLDALEVLASFRPTQPPPPSTPPRSMWLSRSQTLEPDLILLAREPSGARMIAGAVCFPSSWRPVEKIGRTLNEIHAAVPDLNNRLGHPIDTFLDRIAPGIAWFRANWGLTASPEWNQHPDRNLPRIPSVPDPAATLLRIEYQALLALPATRGLLFGIRIEHHPLTRLAATQPAAAAALARALRSMPDDMAQYKGLASNRLALAETLAPDRTGS